MSIVVNIYYRGEGGSAKGFAEEMMASGIVSAIRNEPGNLGYEYFSSMDEPDTVLLIDIWENQRALDAHHDSPMMRKIVELREKYDVHMEVKRFVPDEGSPSSDLAFTRK